MRILIVDEDPALAEALPQRLRREGHRVYTRPDLDGALDLVLAEGIDLVVADPAVAGEGDVLDFAHGLRRDTSTMLLLAGRRMGVGERVRLLEAGADAHLSKPCDLLELLANIHALLRRHPLSIFGRGLGIVQATEDLWLDLAGRRLVGKGGTVGLSDVEFRLLAYMVGHQGVVLSREALLQAVWGGGYEGSDREVDVYVRYLRRKIEPNPSRPRYILTVWGVGYQYARPPLEARESIGELQQSLRPSHARAVGDF